MYVYIYIYIMYYHYCYTYHTFPEESFAVARGSSGAWAHVHLTTPEARGKGKRMYPLLFGVFGLGASGCLGLYRVF